MNETPSPRLHGTLLRIVSHVLASPLAGPLRRAIGAQVIEKKLASVDFAAEGDPLPLYEPRAYEPRDGARGA